MKTNLRVDNFLNEIDCEAYLNRIIVKTMSWHTYTGLNNTLIQYVNCTGLSITTKTFAYENLLAFMVIIQVDAHDSSLVTQIEDHLKKCGFVQRSVKLEMHETATVSRSEFHDLEMSRQ